MRSKLGLGVCFLLLAIAFVGWAVRHGGWSYVLLYPALSFAMVAVAYLGAGHAVFGKGSDGRRRWLASLLLAPYLLLAYLAWHGLRWTARTAPVSDVLPDLMLSRRLLSHELPGEVRSVIDLTCELSDPVFSWQIDQYRCFPMLDGVGAEPDRLIAIAEEILRMPTPVLIHCAQGHGRTGLVAAVVLMISGHARSAEQALDFVESARPGLVLSRAQREDLLAVQTKCSRLRVDGIYSAFDGAMYRHLRFWDNGKVAFLLIALDANEVANGMNESFQAKCGGTYQLQAGQVSFIIIDRGFDIRDDVVVEYRGEVCINSLILDIYSHTTQHRSCERFDFVPLNID